MDLPVDDPKRWEALVQTYLVESHAFTDKLYGTMAPEERKEWPSSPEGLALCALLKELWLATLARWESLAQANDPHTTPDHILWAASITQKILDHMCLDYRYRTNDAPPSGPLWDYLEKELDMPAQCERLLDLFDACDNKWASIHGAMCESLHETMALTALARTHLPYPLRDTNRNKLLLNHMAEFRVGFYQCALQDPLPEETILYAFEHFTPEPQSSPAVMIAWFEWLATLQAQPSVWQDAQKRWPDITHLVAIAGSLVPPGHIGSMVLAGYNPRCLADQDMVAQSAANALFEP